MQKFVLFFLLTTVGMIALCQEKKRLTHDDYAPWKQISSPLIGHDGQWLAYELNPQEGDGELILRNLDSGFQQVFPRAQNAAFSPGGHFLVFRIKPEKAVERQAKVDKKRREEMPADSLGIFLLGSLELIKFPALESFSLPKESSDWLTYVIDHARLAAEEEEGETEEEEGERERGGEGEMGEEEEGEKEGGGEGEMGEEEEDEEEVEEERPGKVLVVFNPVTGDSVSVRGIDAYEISEHGNLVVGLTEKKQKDTLALWELVVVHTSELNPVVVDSRHGEMKQLALDQAGGQLAWLFSADTTDHKTYAVYHYDAGAGQMQKLVHHDMPGMPDGHGPSEHSRPYFSDNGQRLFLGTAPLPEPEPEDTLLADEKYALDIWHWQDPMLQSQQKVLVNQLRRRSFPAVYHMNRRSLVQLADEEMPSISLDRDNNASYAMGQSPVPYMIERQWMGGNPRDLYVVNLADGSRRKVATRMEANAAVAPAGNHMIWYDTGETAWKAYAFNRETTTNLTEGIDVAFYNELNDLPMFARPYGMAGWTPNDREVLLYDRYDVWKVDPTGRNPAENMTGGYGRQNRIVLRVQNLDRDDPFIRLDEAVYLSGFDERSRQSGFYKLEGGQLEQLLMEDAALSGLQKAKQADRFIYRKSTFNMFPDIWVTGPGLSPAERVSDANPQQADYQWGDVRLVAWQDFNNDTLEGLLYVPEDIDESKTYPLLVYFYERSSNGLHQHFIPSPSRSTINRSYCTSNGYVVFVPDITYVTGFPGESAYNAIVSGTKAMVERYPFIDRENMGLQGQSWGGYQIAYLVTRTNMFRAAMAGAPVSNMISAYGGIRWQTGLNRQFQYERTQSRIGGNLWEKPLRYIENSPVFFADKIETPLLMMHNDDDGAVPWYQGIELFTAMRRLSKPVWMLVYNGEAHNLTKWPNRMDLSVRMYQFFDHYLKGEPAPVWLKHGIPAVDKGRTHGYELVE